MQSESNTPLSVRPRILVVDDEKTIRLGCRESLLQEDYDVDTAETGDRGMDMIQTNHYDVILLDLMMPGLSGFEVLARVKDLHPGTVVIVITGYATVEHSIEAMRKGAFDFLPKPFTPDRLKVVVSKALDYTRALQDIAGEKSRMRVLINICSAGILVTDAEKNIVLANPAFLKIMRYPDDAFMGCPAAEVLPCKPILEMIDQALTAAPDPLYEDTREIQLTDGEDRSETFYSVRCVPFLDRIGRIVGTVTVLQDITHLKKLDQLKTDFVSMVAHEIRGPMNSVLAQIHILSDGLAGDITPKQNEILNRMAARVNSLQDLANDLLDLVKKEAGLVALQREACDIQEILKEQVGFQQPKAAAKGLSLELAEMPDLPPVMANRHNMEEVFANLITNAIHYTFDAGTITVGARPEGSRICVTIADTGIGIAPEDKERIFDRFFRVKNEKTRYVTGTGLGLPIVKRIIDAHDGAIRVESELGRGTTFYVYLPVKTAS